MKRRFRLGLLKVEQRGFGELWAAWRRRRGRGSSGWRGFVAADLGFGGGLRWLKVVVLTRVLSGGSEGWWETIYSGFFLWGFFERGRVESSFLCVNEFCLSWVNWWCEIFLDLRERGSWVIERDMLVAEWLRETCWWRSDWERRVGWVMQAVNLKKKRILCYLILTLLF